MPAPPIVAIFRPPDDRATEAHRILEGLGAEALLDPLIVPEPTGAVPRQDAGVTIFTSSTAADILDAANWHSDTTVVAIGPKTAGALRQIGIDVDVVPERYSSAGLVDELAATVAGARVEVARSDHGSPTLLDGLNAAGAYVHETVLYRLERPDDAGRSIDAVRDGDVDGIAFTSSLTVERFLDLAADRGVEDAVRTALGALTVGAIGEPTARTAAENGLSVDVVADEATFESLAERIIEDLDPASSRSV